MKKTVFCIVLVIFFMVFCYVLKFVCLQNNVKNIIINPNLVNAINITVDKEKLYFDGEIVANSFYGSYEGYSYKINGNKLFLTFYSEKSGYDNKEIVNLNIDDKRILNINQIYISGNKFNKLVWER